MQSVGDKSGFLAENVDKKVTKPEHSSLLYPHVACSAKQSIYQSISLPSEFESMKDTNFCLESCLNITLIRM